MEIVTDTDEEQRRRPSSIARAARRDHPASLREMIPSHQIRSESIIRRANNFRPSDAEAASPIQPHSESRAAPRPSPLPTTTKTTENSADGTSEIRTREIGYLGELFVFEMFTQKIDDWTFECWTSLLRSEAGQPRFHGHEGDFSDFTYVDTFGKMRAILREAGVDLNAAWSNATKFHLEVKSTLGSCADPMFVSQNQVDKMREFDGTADDAYILLRVFDLDDGRTPGVKFFRDPWSLYIDGILNFRSDEGYEVYQ